MKRSILVCVALLATACQHLGATPDDGRHHSRFGFAAEVPEAWQLLEAEDVPDGALAVERGVL